MQIGFSGKLRTYFRRCRHAFTLVEMLVVIGIMALLMTLLAPAFNLMGQSKSFTNAAYDIAGMFEQARSYAMGNNTYVFVGLLQVPSGADIYANNAAYGDKVSGKTLAFQANGTLVACAVASKDGTSHFDYGKVKDTWSMKYANGGNLVLLGKIRQWEHTQLTYVPVPNDINSKLYRPDPSVGGFTAMILADRTAKSLTPFSIPLGTSLDKGKLNFYRVVMFDPQGISRIVSDSEVDAVSYVMEVGLMPTRGNSQYPAAAAAIPTPPPADKAARTNCIALQFNAMTGTSKIYRP